MPREIAVHPNSMAARKWKRTSWTTRLDERELPAGAAGRPARRRREPPLAVEALFRRAAGAATRGEYELAAALRAAAMRSTRTEYHCG